MKFEIDLTGKLPDLTNIEQKIGLPKLMEQEMLNTRARIIADTTAGKTAEGGGLKPYSRSYIEAIDSGTVEGKAPGNHTVNLTATGQLLRSFVIEAQGLIVHMFFFGTHFKAKAVSHKHAEKKRKNATKAGHVLQHKGNRPAQPTGGTKNQAVKLGSVKGSKKRGGGGGGGDTQNAIIAKSQYEMGRGGWMAFSKADIERINKRVIDAIQKLFTSSQK